MSSRLQENLHHGDAVARHRCVTNADLGFNTAEQHDEHNNEASPVLAMYAVDKHRVVVSVHKHPQSLGYLLLALSQPEHKFRHMAGMQCQSTITELKCLVVMGGWGGDGVGREGGGLLEDPEVLSYLH